MKSCMPPNEKQTYEIKNTKPAQDAIQKSESLLAISKNLRTSLSSIFMQIEAIEDGMYENNRVAIKKLQKKLRDFESQINDIGKK